MIGRWDVGLPSVRLSDRIEALALVLVEVSVGRLLECAHKSVEPVGPSDDLFVAADVRDEVALI